ncbi:hypothetical protein FA13DRAFT_1711073 [Coprinellus micaceus]|uniref:Uncharacterized protein n=1 Tax=Coprinellus micaceus TaxID=71717 RepID=A0A4Y7T690_COPMI|nr:hypothetical protein FA13DRAFT_1711073 [Coprinellus micaceus]
MGEIYSRTAKDLEAFPIPAAGAGSLPTVGRSSASFMKVCDCSNGKWLLCERKGTDKAEEMEEMLRGLQNNGSQTVTVQIHLTEDHGETIHCRKTIQREKGIALDKVYHSREQGCDFVPFFTLVKSSRMMRKGCEQAGVGFNCSLNGQCGRGYSSGDLAQTWLATVVAGLESLLKSPDLRKKKKLTVSQFRDAKMFVVCT